MSSVGGHRDNTLNPGATMAPSEPRGTHPTIGYLTPRIGDNVSQAQSEAYQACGEIDWDGAFIRNDIGYRAIPRERDNETP